MYVSEGDFAEL